VPPNASIDNSAPAGDGQTRKSRGRQFFKLHRSSAGGCRVSLEDEEWWDHRPYCWRLCRSSKTRRRIFIPTPFVQLVPGRLVVPKVDELTRTEVQCVRPVVVFSTHVEDNVLLVGASPCCAKPALVPTPSRILEVGSSAASLFSPLIDSIYD
jgi:hypothetical protein